MIPDKMSTRLNDFLLYLRHLYAYEFAKTAIPKNSYVLDLGFGEEWLELDILIVSSLTRIQLAL